MMMSARACEYIITREYVKDPDLQRVTCGNAFNGLSGT